MTYGFIEFPTPCPKCHGPLALPPDITEGDDNLWYTDHPEAVRRIHAEECPDAI